MQAQNQWEKLYRISRGQVAPVLMAYVAWVLDNAARRGIRRLYFLARDGFILREMAEMLCRARGLEIECRYLYCSRRSLRMPGYHLIGPEAYDLLFLGGYHVKLHSFLERAGIPPEEWSNLLRQAGLAEEDPERELRYREIAALREKLQGTEAFCRWVEENSRAAYPAAMGYLRQEGLLEQERLALVDSGWTGSVQRSLRQLLESAGYRGEITGFYFGLFVRPRDPADGEYLSWYFSAGEGLRNKLLFCNNLFECMLSAPHGMTVGYEERDGIYGPQLLQAPEGPQAEAIAAQLEGLREGARLCLSGEREIPGRKQSGKILRRLMGRPDREEAAVYGSFTFCDDITEAYSNALAGPGQTDALNSYLLLPRVADKLFKRKRPKGSELFWPFGTLAFVDGPFKRLWYRGNILLLSWLQNIGK